MDKLKKHIWQDKYKIGIIAIFIGIMIMAFGRTMRHPVGDLLGKSISGYSPDFLKITTVLLFVILIAGFILVCCRVKKWKIEQASLVMGIVFGLLYMVVLPPFTTPDEVAHVDTAYYYSSKLLGKEALDAKGGVLFREDDAIYTQYAQTIPDAESYAIMYYNFFKLDHSSTDVSFGREKLAVSAIAYAPQIIGVAAARLFHMGNIQMLLWGRMFALAFYLACLYWAIKIAPIGKELLMVAGLMPTTMQMAASFSYDSSILALSFLYTGILLYLAFEAPKVTWKHIVILMIIFACLAPAKLVYVGLAFTMLIVPAEKFKNKYYKYISVAIMVLAGAAVILMTRFQTVAAIGSSAGGMMGEQSTYSWGYLLHHPMRIITIIFGTVIGQGSYLLETMIGQHLGWLEIMVPGYILYGFFTLLILASIRKNTEEYIFTSGQRLWIFLVIAGVTGLIGLAFLFDWTPLEAVNVCGLQGRYFLPMLPLLMMLCKNHQLEIKENMTRYIIVAVYVLQFATIYHVYATIAGR